MNWKETLYFAVYNEHLYFCIIQGLLHLLLYPRYVITIPMYNVHPDFPLKMWAKKCMLDPARGAGWGKLAARVGQNGKRGNG